LVPKRLILGRRSSRASVSGSIRVSSKSLRPYTQRRDDPKDTFLNQVKTLIRLGLGKDGTALPGWAVALIRDCDVHFSEEMRAELLIEGCILLEK
jgi:hypothetical protein